MNVIPDWFSDKDYNNVYIDVTDIAIGFANQFKNEKYYFIKFLEEFESSYCIAKITRIENKDIKLQIEIVKIQNNNKLFETFTCSLSYSVIDFIQNIDQIIYTNLLR